MLALAGLLLAASADAEELPADSLAAGDALSADALALQDDEAAPAEPLEYSRPGGYLGVGGAYALQNFSIPGGQDDAASIAFRGGYRGEPWLAVELLGEVLTTFEGTGPLDNDVRGYAVTVNAKVLAPLGRVEPWLEAGVGLLDMDQDRRSHRQEDFVFRSAVGLDLHVTPHWAVYGEAAYLLPTGDVERYDYATFGGGLLYRF